jgi:acetylornithine deacetylase/succinyl-diaminopimelate desuccinylase-like protein
MPRNLAGTDRPIVETVSALMPGLQSDLARLVAIPSISSPGYPEPRQSILDAYELTVELLRDAGVQDLGALELPDTAPVITGEIPAPEGAPTVLLYSHYDVVPAGDEALWSSSPR